MIGLTSRKQNFFWMWMKADFSFSFYVLENCSIFSKILILGDQGFYVDKP